MLRVVVALWLLAFSVDGFLHLTKINFDRQMMIMRRTSDDRDMWLEQKLDNFHPSDQRTWMQRYFKEDKFSRSGGPVFLQIGGEGPANPIWMEHGHWITMAKQLGAYCFMIEHRYYGKSHPTSDVSTANLSYLSSEQALADVANFIVTMTSKYGLGARKWIVFGGSYSGALAVWARMKYPHLVSGAVSSSAPLNAMVDFSAYLDVATNALGKFGSTTCAENLSVASKQVATNLKTTDGLKLLEKLFKLCTPVHTGGYDDDYLQQALAGNIMGVVQYNKDYRAFEGGAASNVTIETICQTMDDKSLGDAIHRYAKFNDIMMEAYELTCLDVSYESYLKQMRESSWEEATGGRQWVYQTCTEFGWYQNSDSNVQPFIGFPLKFTLDQCASVYGISPDQVAQGVKRTNEQYGALKVAEVVSYVTLYNGGVDPWSNVSYVSDSGSFKRKLHIGNTRLVALEKTSKTSGIFTTFVPDTAHCAIMYPASPQDSPALTEARKAVEREVASWFSVGSDKLRVL